MGQMASILVCPTCLNCLMQSNQIWYNKHKEATMLTSESLVTSNECCIIPRLYNTSANNTRSSADADNRLDVSRR